MQKIDVARFSTIVALVTVFVTHLLYADTATVNGITWTYTVSNGEASLSSVPTSTKGDLAIPPTLNGYPVTRIKSYAFRNCSGLTSVTIPDGVTSIGAYAFDFCYRLSEVHITDVAKWCGISFDGSSANPLYYAAKLYFNGSLVVDLNIPDGVTSIGAYAFYNCSGLTSVTIPNGVTSIGDNAFRYCGGLTNMTIPNTVTNIGSGAFQSCCSLTDITIPDSVTRIQIKAFDECSSLENVYITDIASWCRISLDVTSADTYSSNPLNYADNLYLNGLPLTDLIIPSNVTNIRDRACS